jgi:glycosyltransferase involved in cell wall biosynthesis
MNFHLGLFFTRGVSLKTWDMVGNLDREIAIYRRMVDAGNKVTFFTYGNEGDLKYLDRLKDIGICPNKDDLSLEDYESVLPTIHEKTLERLDVIKTNQSYGAELALDVANRLGKPLVVRCGYMWSQNAVREHGADSAIAREAFRVEEKVFSGADSIIVTTAAMRYDVVSRLPEAERKLVVIPNYVDTGLFRPMDVPKNRTSIVFVGRIAPEKNLVSLIEAIRDLDVTLTIVGEGNLRPALQDKFTDLASKLTWEGGVPNSELPELMNRSCVFVLPSLYEGHPKSLIEAMACGIPVIGCDSPGIREIISHGNNGLLCSPDAKSLKKTITMVISDSVLAEHIASNARKFVERNFSLDVIADLEIPSISEISERERALHA